MEWEDDQEDDDLQLETRKHLPNTVVWTTDWTTGSLVDQMRRDVFDVDPPFQRRFAWGDQKASLYIESLLLGCPVPPITLAETSYGSAPGAQYVVIDGKQRLGSLKRFAIDQQLRLTGLQVLGDLNGLTYSEVAATQEFARFENLPVRTVVLRNWTQDSVLQFIFQRLNSQVTPLSTHELRRSIYPGPFTEYLDERSAVSPGLQRILNLDEPDSRLRDAELLLRALVFIRHLAKYSGNLKKFLDTHTRSYNKNWDSSLKKSLDDTATSIEAGIDTTYEIFGKSAFQRLDNGEATGRFNRAVFDIMLLVFQFEDVRNEAAARSDELNELYERLMGEASFAQWTSATTKSKDAVRGRVEEWAKGVGSIVGVTDLVDRVFYPK